jgi:hypothetical protein
MELVAENIASFANRERGTNHSLSSLKKGGSKICGSGVTEWSQNWKYLNPTMLATCWDFNQFNTWGGGGRGGCAPLPTQYLFSSWGVTYCVYTV